MDFWFPNQGYLKWYTVYLSLLGWLLVTFLTKQRKMSAFSFYRKLTPADFGWKEFLDRYPNERQVYWAIQRNWMIAMIRYISMVYAAYSLGIFYLWKICLWADHRRRLLSILEVWLLSAFWKNLDYLINFNWIHSGGHVTLMLFNYWSKGIHFFIDVWIKCFLKNVP